MVTWHCDMVTPSHNVTQYRCRMTDKRDHDSLFNEWSIYSIQHDIVLMHIIIHTHAKCLHTCKHYANIDTHTQSCKITHAPSNGKIAKSTLN